MPPDKPRGGGGGGGYDGGGGPRLVHHGKKVGGGGKVSFNVASLRWREVPGGDLGGDRGDDEGGGAGTGGAPPPPPDLPEAVLASILRRVARLPGGGIPSVLAAGAVCRGGVVHPQPWLASFLCTPPQRIFNRRECPTALATRRPSGRGGHWYIASRPSDDTGPSWRGGGHWNTMSTQSDDITTVVGKRAFSWAVRRYRHTIMSKQSDGTGPWRQGGGTRRTRRTCGAR